MFSSHWDGGSEQLEAYYLPVNLRTGTTGVEPRLHDEACMNGNANIWGERPLQKLMNTPGVSKPISAIPEGIIIAETLKSK